ncbi:hypothetical protein LINPERPRIM_LOCUS36739 [Linum perenne]
MRPANKEKGKAIATTSKKLAIAAEEVDKMRDDAYKLAIEGSSSSEYQFPYIPITYQCMTWFWDWGIFPICMPNKVPTVYEQFVEANPGLQHPRFIFAKIYHVPWVVRWDYVKTPKESTYAKRGLIRVVPPKKQLPLNEEKPSLPDLIKNLLKDVPKDVLKSELIKPLEDGSMDDDHSENSVNKDDEDGSLNDDLLDEDETCDDMEINNNGRDA